MGIFKTLTLCKESIDILSTWNILNQRELKLTVTHPASNYFQKMILWTDQNKIWTFPINNEQSVEIENDIYFSDHIFIEQYIESWCPKKGPIRHFMELVCVGLSKNCYISVKDKRDHVDWFKNYFNEKKDLLSTLIIEQKSSKIDSKINC